MDSAYSPLVSVLIPVYQVERYIERCARSVFEQTYHNCEFVFVDDGCTDSSIDLLGKTIDEYPHVKNKVIIIKHEQNKGLSATRNTAINSCHGEFVIHVDSDDWIEPDAISLLVKRQQETDADIVYTKGYYLQKEGITKITCQGWSSEKKALLINLLQDKATISIWSKLIKKSLYIDYGIECDERADYYEDFQVLPRLIYFAKKIACIDDLIYHYNRSNPNSIVTNISQSISIQKQGILSIHNICNFFQNKDELLYSSVKSFYVRYLYRMLSLNFNNSNKKGYYEFLHLLKRTDRREWQMIGWHRLLNRVIDNNYYIKVFTFPLYIKMLHLRRKIIHLFQNQDKPIIVLSF